MTNKYSNETPEEAKKRFKKYILDSSTNKTNLHREKVKMIKVFVLVGHYVSGTVAERVFHCEKSAYAYQNTHKNEVSSPKIKEFTVQGKVENENYIYAVGVYDLNKDIHRLTGIFGNYVDAKSVAGKYGLVVGKKIHK